MLLQQFDDKKQLNPAIQFVIDTIAESSAIYIISMYLLYKLFVKSERALVFYF